MKYSGLSTRKWKRREKQTGRDCGGGAGHKRQRPDSEVVVRICNEEGITTTAAAAAKREAKQTNEQARHA